MAKQFRGSLLVAVLMGGFVFLAVWLGWFPGLELPVQDALYQRELAVDPSIKIIAIDEKTLDALGQFETWTREPYARLIETLNRPEGKPKVIGLDILLVNEKGEEDAALVEACREGGNVVLASNLVLSEKLTGEKGNYRVDSLHVDMVEQPFSPLRDTVQTGFANTVLDSRDGRIRYALLEQGEFASFSSVIAQAAGAEKHPDKGLLIRYTGGPERYETLPMVDVLDGKIPPEAFRDSIVLVGIHAAGMGDTHSVPSQRGAQMYGVEIHANIIQSLLENRSLRQADPLTNALVCAAIAAALALLLPKLSLWGSILGAVAVLAGHGLLCLLLGERGLVVSVLGLPFGILGALVWCIIGKYLSETLQKKKIVRAFQKYVAPQVVEEISQNHDFQIKLGGEKRQIAVLFVDIRGFTPLCEVLPPEQVVEILNEYLDLVTRAVFRNGGTLDKFIGDAAMAVFNAPFDTPDYVYRAVSAARDIAAGSEKIAATFLERFGRAVSYGIGVNCGEAIVGNIGSEFRMDYTAIGDTVNTAARLESNAKPGQILVSEAVVQALGERIAATEVGTIPLKGKTKRLMVYQID